MEEGGGGKDEVFLSEGRCSTVIDQVLVLNTVRLQNNDMIPTRVSLSKQS